MLWWIISNNFKVTQRHWINLQQRFYACEWHWTSDVSVANEPILLNGSLVRTRGTESYLVRAVLVIVQSLVRTHCLPKSTRLLKSLILFPVFCEEPPLLWLVGFSTRSEMGWVLTEYARERSHNKWYRTGRRHVFRMENEPNAKTQQHLDALQPKPRQW